MSIAAHQKEELMKFIQKVKPDMNEFELLSIKNTLLQNVYFPKVMPDLTDLLSGAQERLAWLSRSETRS